MIEYDLGQDEYHQRPGISATGLKQIYRSPAHYRYWKEHPPEPTPAMIKGSALHAAILEPLAFANKYACLDDDEICALIGGARPRATNEYRAWKGDFELKNAGKTMLEKQTYLDVQEMAKSVFSDIRAYSLLEYGRAETSITWIDEATEIEVRIRPDWIATNAEYAVIDIKTCKDARRDEFARDIWNRLYHIQAALYVEGVRREFRLERHPLFMFFAVESEPPYAVEVYELDPDALRTGALDVEMCLYRYKKCVESDFWPGYSTGNTIQPIGLPRWANIAAVSGERDM